MKRRVLSAKREGEREGNEGKNLELEVPERGNQTCISQKRISNPPSDKKRDDRNPVKELKGRKDMQKLIIGSIEIKNHVTYKNRRQNRLQNQELVRGRVSG